MKVFQIGAAGGVGRRLARELLARGDVVSGQHRRPDQAEAVRATGATPVTGDLVRGSVDELTAALAGHDAVVFSAGAHGAGLEQTTAIDGLGLQKAATAAADAGVSRFVLVSVFPDALRGGQPSPAFEHYIRVKKTADVHLAGTDLDWLIVRPGTLTDAPGSGLVSAGPAVEYGDVPRDDVAAFIAAALHDPALNRAVVELTAGHTPISAALARLTGTPAPRPS